MHNFGFFCRSLCETVIVFLLSNMKKSIFLYFFCLVIDLLWNGFDLDFYCYLT